MIQFQIDTRIGREIRELINISFHLNILYLSISKLDRIKTIL